MSSLSPLVESAGRHAELNHYRIAFGATAFPFRDPAPIPSEESEKKNPPPPPLLGVRIDVSTRRGQFVKPYYILLKQERIKRPAASGEEAANDDDDSGIDFETRLRIHRHTIPAFISTEKLAALYLPFPASSSALVESPNNNNDGNASESSLKPWKKSATTAGTRRQDLKTLVRTLRRELSSWHIRVDAVDMLRQSLGFGEKEGLEHGIDEEQSADSSVQNGSKNGLGIVSLSATSLEARYVRLEWENGRVGQFKLTNSGTVERAVIIGIDNRRDKVTENALTGGDARVEGVLDRLPSL